MNEWDGICFFRYCPASWVYRRLLFCPCFFIGLEGKSLRAGSLFSVWQTFYKFEPGKKREPLYKGRLFSKLKVIWEGGFEAWQQAGEKTDLIINVEADESYYGYSLRWKKSCMVDVRKVVEFGDGHVKKRCCKYSTKRKWQGHGKYWGQA